MIDDSDGGAVTTFALTPSQTSYPVITGLPAGRHTVRLVKHTEAQIGTVRFTGFQTDGQFGPPPPPLTRRIEIIGDSIRCGFGDEGQQTPPQSCLFTPDTENVDDSYGVLAAKSLNAELHDIAFAGRHVA